MHLIIQQKFINIYYLPFNKSFLLLIYHLLYQRCPFSFIRILSTDHKRWKHGFLRKLTSYTRNQLITLNYIKYFVHNKKINSFKFFLLNINKNSSTTLLNNTSYTSTNIRTQRMIRILKYTSQLLRSHSIR